MLGPRRIVLTPNFERPRSPVVIDRAFDDPERIRQLVRNNAPYWPTIRYVANQSELRALSSSDMTLAVQPWFRGDWAYDEPLVDGAAEILANKGFIDAAHAVFDADVVRPQIVYVNVMGPMGAGPAHIDVPAFRGIDRTQYPVTLLHLMHRSGLFEDYRVGIATAVAWFYEGERGEFEYWADGVDAPPRRIEAPLSNRAVVGDNEFMFHRVAPIGAPDPPDIQGATLDVELRPAADGSDWCAVDGGVELLRYAERDIRVSISWKAEVFADEEAARVRAEHLDDLRLDRVVDDFARDLAKRGHDLTHPEDPLHDEHFTRVLSEAYPLPVPRGSAA
jgi:hypothetical protein